MFYLFFFCLLILFLPSIHNRIILSIIFSLCFQSGNIYFFSNTFLFLRNELFLIHWKQRHENLKGIAIIVYTVYSFLFLFIFNVSDFVLLSINCNISIFFRLYPPIERTTTTTTDDARTLEYLKLASLLWTVYWWTFQVHWLTVVCKDVPRGSFLSSTKKIVCGITSR